MSESLDEVRKAYPQYKDWSDRELADALKDKYYADMPDEEYYSQIGLNVNPMQFSPGSTDYETPGGALVDAGMRAPGRILDTASAIGGGLMDLFNNSPSDYGNAAMKGLAGGAEVLANVPHNLVEYIREHQKREQQKKSEFEQNHPLISKIGNAFGRTSSEELIPISDDLKAWRPSEQDTQTFKNAQQYWNPTNQQAPGTQLVEGFTKFIPSLLASGGNPYVAAVINSVGENKNIAEDLIPFLAAEGGIKGAGAGISKVGGAIADKFSQARKIAKQAEGLLSPEELARNVRAAEGTHTDIGSVIGSPELAHKLSNEIIPQAKDTVVDKIMRQREKEVQQRAEQVGDATAQGKLTNVDLNPLVEKLTQEAKRESEFVKNELYKPIDKLAESEGIKLELPSFKEIASENAASIENSPMLKADSKFKNRYNKLLGLQKTENVTPGKIVDKSGKPLTETVQTSSISDAKAIFNDLYTEGLRMEKSESAVDRATGKLYKRLAKAGNADIQNLLNNKGSKKIRDTYEKAQEHYRSDFSRFLDKDVRKFLDENKDYDSIVHDIIKPSKIKDNFSQIEKIIDVLPKEQKHLLGAAYLQKAFDQYGVLQPTEMANLWNKLGKRQQNALFPDAAMRQSIHDFINLKNMNAEALNKWFNPKTGAKNQGMIAQLMEVVKGSGPGGVIGGSIGTILGGPPGGLLGGAAGTVAGKAISKANNTRLAKLYTSPEFRRAVLDRMEKNQTKKSRPISDAEFTQILKQAAKDFAIAETAASEEGR
ncbi:MAG: hypothetical protein KIH63_004750 [Candidatus Saccharibacteria bacterium]|nr:hypothetical protein [Candidatus Saccharibacteria bacterium]